MPETSNFFCHFCKEEIAWTRENPLFSYIVVGQPGDRQGTSIDLDQVPPFMAALFACPISRMDICEDCFEKAFKIDMEFLRPWFEWNNVSVDFPGSPHEDVLAVKMMHENDPRRKLPKFAPLVAKIFPSQPE